MELCSNSCSTATIRSLPIIYNSIFTLVSSLNRNSHCSSHRCVMISIIAVKTTSLCWTQSHHWPLFIAHQRWNITISIKPSRFCNRSVIFTMRFVFAMCIFSIKFRYFSICFSFGLNRMAITYSPSLPRRNISRCLA